jgi:hypothetical protein
VASEDAGSPKNACWGQNAQKTIGSQLGVPLQSSASSVKLAGAQWQLAHSARSTWRAQPVLLISVTSGL